MTQSDTVQYIAILFTNIVSHAEIIITLTISRGLHNISLSQENCDSALLRVLHEIRKNPMVESESDHIAPSKGKTTEHLPGKENSSPNIENSEALSSPFSLSPEHPQHHVSQAARSSEWSNHHSTGSTPSEHTSKELHVALHNNMHCTIPQILADLYSRLLCSYRIRSN